MAVVLHPSASHQSLDPTISLSQALRDFESALTGDQKTLFRISRSKPDGSSVHEFVTRLDENNKSRSSRCFAPRLLTFLDRTQQFASIVDTFVSSHPTVAALFWGSIKTAILSARNIASYFEKVSELLMTIGRLCPTYQQFSILYSGSADVQNALCEYYTVIVHICTKIVTILQRTGTAQMISSVFNPFESEFKPFLGDLRTASDTFERQVWLASKQAERDMARIVELERQENHSHRISVSIFQRDMRTWNTELLDLRDLVMKRECESLRFKIQEYLASFNHEQPWRHATKLRCPSTTDWFKRDSSYISWMDNPGAGLLWCTGKMGSGKTILTSNVVSHLKALQMPSQILAYFFCRFDDQQSLQAKTIIGSILKQMIRPNIAEAKHGELRSLLEALEQIDILEPSNILDLLQPILRKSQASYTIVLDGLEECEESEIRSAIRVLAILLKHWPNNVKVFCACRPEYEDMVSTSMPIKHRISLSRTEVHEDISHFIDLTLDERLESQSLITKDPTLILQIQKKLQERAHGSFLWLQLVIDELCMQDSDNAIRATLDKLPSGLFGLFERKLNRISSGQRARQVLKVIQMCGVSKRALGLDELSEALTVEPGQSSLDRGKLTNNMRRLIADTCGLIHIDEEESTVHYVHHSVRVHLFGGDSAQASNFDENVIEEQFGMICMTYLNFNDFDRQLVKAQPSTLHQSATLHQPVDIAVSALENQGVRSRLARYLLKRGSSSRKTGIDIAIIAAKEDPVTRWQMTGHVDLTNQFHFLAYAREYCLFHVKDIELTEKTKWTLFLKTLGVLLQKAHKPWTIYRKSEVDLFGSEVLINSTWRREIESELRKENFGSMFQWASEHTHTSFLRVLLTGLDPWRDSKALLELIGRVPRDRLCWIFESWEPELDEIQQSQWRKVLLKGATGNNRPTLEMLLNNVCAARESSFDSHKSEPLALLMLYAVSHHLVWLLELLADVGVNCTATNEFGRPVLHLVVKPSENSILETLLRVQPDIEHTPRSSMPSTRRTISAHENTSQTYSSETSAGVHGSDSARGAVVSIDQRDDRGMTALHEASKYGYLKAVHLLLRAGASVNLQDSSGSTALHMAIENNSIGTHPVLLQAGASVNLQDSKGFTALHETVTRRSTEIVAILLQAGASVDLQNSGGFTALHLAAMKYDSMETVEMLLQAGASVDLQNSKGFTALHKAVIRRSTEIVAILLQAGASVDLQDYKGFTALHQAVRFQNKEIVGKLLEVKADLRIQTKYGETALDMAKQGVYKKRSRGKNAETIREIGKLLKTQSALEDKSHSEV